MALRRGFKSEATSLAREVRGELKLSSVAPLDPRQLAAHLEIPIIPLAGFIADVPEVVRYFTRRDSKEFSAVTVFDGPRRLIVFNHAHAPGRQANDLAHELAHGLLLHEPGPALDESGCRRWNEDEEDEADWLGGALLVPDEAAIHSVQSGWDLADAARQYGVSVPLMRWRLNSSGAYIRVRRSQRFQGR